MIESKLEILDVLKLFSYCVLLIIPVYAITSSALAQNWLMFVIDILLIPVAFVHGLLLIAGMVN